MKPLRLCHWHQQAHTMTVLNAEHSLVRVGPRHARHVLLAHWVDLVGLKRQLSLVVVRLAGHHGAAGRVEGRPEAQRHVGR